MTNFHMSGISKKILVGGDPLFYTGSPRGHTHQGTHTSQCVGDRCWEDVKSEPSHVLLGIGTAAGETVLWLLKWFVTTWPAVPLPVMCPGNVCPCKLVHTCS